MSWCLFLDVCGKFRGCGKQLREYVVNMREMCERNGASFLDLGKKNRRYGRQVREYVVDMREMCQCHGACVLDVGENSVGTGDN